MVFSSQRPCCKQELDVSHNSAGNPPGKGNLGVRITLTDDRLKQQVLHNERAGEPARTGMACLLAGKLNRFTNTGLAQKIQQLETTCIKVISSGCPHCAKPVLLRRGALAAVPLGAQVKSVPPAALGFSKAPSIEHAPIWPAQYKPLGGQPAPVLVRHHGKHSEGNFRMAERPAPPMLYRTLLNDMHFVDNHLWCQLVCMHCAL